TASNSGIEPNDIIIGFDDFDVTSPDVLRVLLSSSPAGRKVKLKTLRGDKTLDVDVVLSPRDFDPMQIPVFTQAANSNTRKASATAMPSPGSTVWPYPGPDPITPAGFAVRDLTPQLAEHFKTPGGALVTYVEPGSLADRAGLKTGDVIIGIRDAQSPTSAKLISVLSARRGIVPLRVARQNARLLISINLGSQAQTR